VTMVASTSLVRLRTSLDLDVGRQRAPDRLHLLVNVGGDKAAVPAFEHHCGANHDLVAVLAGRTGPKLAADADVRHILEVDGDARGDWCEPQKVRRSFPPTSASTLWASEFARTL
jgi:hypothetical protein